MDQDVEQRLARIEKRIVFAVSYSSVALIWVIAQPEAVEFSRTLGLSPRSSLVVTALFAGAVGALLTRVVLKRTSN